MNIKLTEDHENIDWLLLAEVYEKAPLGTREPYKLEAVFKNSEHKCFLFDQNKIIGAARAISDGFDCAVICDVAILPEYQGKSLGRLMMNHLMEKLSRHNKILLYSAPGKEGFYLKQGFRKMKTAMAIFSDQKKAFDGGFIE